MINNYLYHLNELMQSFYIITGISTVAFDDKFNVVAWTEDADFEFCAILRRDAAANANCVAQDHRAFKKCSEINSLYLYKCHIGLTEAVAPIKFGNIIIGYLTFGHMISNDDPSTHWDEVKKQCLKYNADTDALYNAYKGKKAMTQEQMHAIAQLLEACAGYLWLKHQILMDNEKNIIFYIDEYIANNLGKDLSINTLCKKFSISRSTLYRLGIKYYHSSVDQVVKDLRIKKAKELLESSDLAVKEIAFQLGYADYNYFAKAFKSVTTLSPVQFRKKTTSETK